MTSPCIRCGSKWSQLLIALAAPGSHAKTVLHAGCNCSRVSLWQWSGLFWLIKITSGSSISDRCDIDGFSLKTVLANHEASTIELPVRKGSIKTVYAPLAEVRSLGEGFSRGEKVRRKELSALRCLTTRLMVSTLTSDVVFSTHGKVGTSATVSV